MLNIMEFLFGGIPPERRLPEVIAWTSPGVAFVVDDRGCVSSGVKSSYWVSYVWFKTEGEEIDGSTSADERDDWCGGLGLLCDVTGGFWMELESLRGGRLGNVNYIVLCNIQGGRGLEEAAEKTGDWVIPVGAY